MRWENAFYLEPGDAVRLCVDGDCFTVTIENITPTEDGRFDIEADGFRRVVSADGISRVNLCSCGSGEERRARRDGRGIFLTYTCSACDKEKMGRYRPEILGHYTEEDVIERIEPDY